MCNNYNAMPELLPDDAIERAKKLNSALLCDGMKDMSVPMDGAMAPNMLPVNPNAPMMVGTALQSLISPCFQRGYCSAAS